MPGSRERSRSVIGGAAVQRGRPFGEVEVVGPTLQPSMGCSRWLDRLVLGRFRGRRDREVDALAGVLGDVATVNQSFGNGYRQWPGSMGSQGEEAAA